MGIPKKPAKKPKTAGKPVTPPPTVGKKMALKAKQKAK